MGPSVAAGIVTVCAAVQPLSLVGVVVSVVVGKGPSCSLGDQSVCWSWRWSVVKRKRVERGSQAYRSLG